MKRKTTTHKAVNNRGAALCLALLLALTPVGALAATTALSPTTGLPTDKPYRPVLVNVSNSKEARPAWNLSEADIVYEAVIWGPGHTRYLALYNDQHPEYVGSIRGLRVYQAEIRQGWDCPLAHRGGQQEEGTNIYDYYAEHKVDPAFAIDDIYKGARPTGQSSNIQGLFTRLNERVSPHNAVVNVAKYVEEYWPKAEDGTPYEPRLPGFAFSDTPTKGDADATTVELQYDVAFPGKGVYNPRYTFNEGERVYERWYDGVEHIDATTGKRLVASNVIVMVCPLSYYEDAASRPIMETVGKGSMDAFIDGRHIAGTWERLAADDQTKFLDEQGEPIVLLPGKTFIQVIPPNVTLDMEGIEGGTYRYGPQAQ